MGTWAEKRQMGMLKFFRTNTADIYISWLGYHFRRKIGGISHKITVHLAGMFVILGGDDFVVEKFSLPIILFRFLSSF